MQNLNPGKTITRGGLNSKQWNSSLIAKIFNFTQTYFDILEPF